MADVSHSNLYEFDAGILPKDACIVLVRTEWNAEIVDKLENGCRQVLEKNGVKDIVVLNVPGAVEIPFMVRHYWEAKKYSEDRPHAFIALGCVIRGGTPHFDYVCKSVTEGVLHLNMHLPIPTIFGVLTVDDHKQAEDRVGGTHGHKGEEAGLTALKMIALVNKFKRYRS